MLYIVGTPIGNLGDLTPRAVETLRSVDVIACEDTRYTGRLLKQLEISKPMISFHLANEHHAVRRLRDILGEGKSVALVSSAGMPGISDPGYLAVREAIAASVVCTVIPGPSAVIAAVLLSGLPAHSFTFRGFPPRKSGKRRAFFEVDAASPHTLVFYESPYRVADSLEDALAVYGDRDGALANDLTKKFEHIERAPLSKLLAHVRETPPRGEYTIVIAGQRED